MKPKPLPELSLLQEYLELDEASPSGLRWIKRPSPAADKGEVAGYFNKKLKRWLIKFKSKLYFAYRIVYYLAHEENPGDFQIDHINGDPSDNRICNLRLATAMQNCSGRLRARKKTSTKPSIYRGVKWDHQRCKWKAYITHSGKTLELGRFTLEKDAALAYDKASKRLNGEFCFLNFR